MTTGTAAPQKFSRTYSVVVSANVLIGANSAFGAPIPGQEKLTIQPPFTMEFDISRSNLSSVNVCQIRLYNLAPNTRSQLLYNTQDFSSNKQLKSITVSVGYQNNIATVFAGSVTQAWSVREGSNFISQIECYDGGPAIVNTDVNLTFPAGTPLATVMAGIIATMEPYGVTLGAIGNFPDPIPKSTTYSGSVIDILNQLSGNAFFIDNSKAYVLRSSDYVATAIPNFIDVDSGLLGTPYLENNNVKFNMLLQPNLTLGSQVILNSLTYPQINGTFLLTGVKHKGIISEVVSGNAITTGTFTRLAASNAVVGT